MSLLTHHYAALLLNALRTHTPTALDLPEAQALSAALAKGDLPAAESAVVLAEREGITPLEAARALGVKASSVYRARARGAA